MSKIWEITLNDLLMLLVCFLVAIIQTRGPLQAGTAFANSNPKPNGVELLFKSGDFSQRGVVMSVKAQQLLKKALVTDGYGHKRVTVEFADTLLEQPKTYSIMRRWRGLKRQLVDAKARIEGLKLEVLEKSEVNYLVKIRVNG